MGTKVVSTSSSLSRNHHGFPAALPTSNPNSLHYPYFCFVSVPVLPYYSLVIFLQRTSKIFYKFAFVCGLTCENLKFYSFIHTQKKCDAMSGVGIVRKKLMWSYCGRPYYSNIGFHKWRVDFTVVLNLESHIAVSIQIVQIMP